MSKIRKRINPTHRKSKDLLRDSRFKSSRQNINTIGMAVNSSQITSGGSDLFSRISARVHRGIPKTKRIMKIPTIKMGGREVNQIRPENTNIPAIEPNVPGAGNLLPRGPRVDKDLIKKSIIHFPR
jgi:hypothetical protein